MPDPLPLATNAGFARPKAYELLYLYGPVALHAAVTAVQDHGFSPLAAEELLEKLGAQLLSVLVNAMAQHAKSGRIPAELWEEIQKHPEAANEFALWLAKRGHQFAVIAGPKVDGWLKTKWQQFRAWLAYLYGKITRTKS